MWRVYSGSLLHPLWFCVWRKSVARLRSQWEGGREADGFHCVRCIRWVSDKLFFLTIKKSSVWSSLSQQNTSRWEIARKGRASTVLSRRCFVLPCGAWCFHGEGRCCPRYPGWHFAPIPPPLSPRGELWFTTSFIKRDEAHSWQLHAVCFSRYSVIERHANILIKDNLLPLV